LKQGRKTIKLKTNSKIVIYLNAGTAFLIGSCVSWREIHLGNDEIQGILPANFGWAFRQFQGKL
jgi:hypothetical protein